MKSSMRSSVSGAFSARNLGIGLWHLCAAAPDGPEIFIRGAASNAHDLFADQPVLVRGVVWRADGARLELAGEAGLRSLSAGTVIIHQPYRRLYQALPLAGFDSDARRFWNRVFLLIRFPGGRLLLKYLARRR